jgi:hypothetical protein
MAGLVPAIHVFTLRASFKRWMPGTRPGIHSKEYDDAVRFRRSAAGEVETVVVEGI